MPVTGFRDRIKDLSPAMFKDGVGEREMYCFGLAIDVLNEKRCQALDARRPPYAQLDALLVLAADKGITPGLTEGRDSLSVRVQRALDTWQTAGASRSVLSQLLAFALSKTPAGFTVATRFDPTTYLPTRLDSSWHTYAEGANLTAPPVHTYCASGGNGDWDWDSLSPVSGSFGWWSAYVGVYSVGAQAWIGAAGTWGSGLKWGAGMTYAAATSGRYSTIVGGVRVLAGVYTGTGQGWGVDAGADVGRAMRRIVQTFKPANVWVRDVVISFNASRFSPSSPAGGGVNPDGTFGHWSKVSSGVRVRSRFSDVRYLGEVTT